MFMQPLTPDTFQTGLTRPKKRNASEPNAPAGPAPCSSMYQSSSPGMSPPGLSPASSTVSSAYNTPFFNSPVIPASVPSYTPLTSPDDNDPSTCWTAANGIMPSFYPDVAYSMCPMGNGGVPTAPEYTVSPQVNIQELPSASSIHSSYFPLTLNTATLHAPEPANSSTASRGTISPYLFTFEDLRRSLVTSNANVPSIPNNYEFTFTPDSQLVSQQYDDAAALLQEQEDIFQFHYPSTAVCSQPSDVTLPASRYAGDQQLDYSDAGVYHQLFYGMFQTQHGAHTSSTEHGVMPAAHYQDGASVDPHQTHFDLPSQTPPLPVTNGEISTADAAREPYISTEAAVRDVMAVLRPAMQQESTENSEADSLSRECSGAPTPNMQVASYHPFFPPASLSSTSGYYSTGASSSLVSHSVYPQATYPQHTTPATQGSSVQSSASVGPSHSNGKRAREDDDEDDEAEPPQKKITVGHGYPGVPFPVPAKGFPDPQDPSQLIVPHDANCVPRPVLLVAFKGKKKTFYCGRCSQWQNADRWHHHIGTRSHSGLPHGEWPCRICLKQRQQQQQQQQSRNDGPWYFRKDALKRHLGVHQHCDKNTLLVIATPQEFVHPLREALALELEEANRILHPDREGKD